MPIIHDSVNYLSTAKLNTVLRRLNARSHGGPQDPTLAALTLKQLVARWQRSTAHADKRLLRLIERIAEAEIKLGQDGGEVLQELAKPRKGLFGKDLAQLASGLLISPQVPKHDPLLLRWQLSDLWCYAKHHAPLPQVPRTRNTDLRRQEMNDQVVAWVQTWWKSYRPLREWALCLCQYKHTQPTYSDLYEKDARYTTTEDLFHRMLAHLHDSTRSAVKKDINNYQQLDRRM